MEENNIASVEMAIKKFEIISGWKDADEQIDICKNKIEELKVKEENDRLEREYQTEIKKRENKLQRLMFKILAFLIAICIIFVIIAKTQ